MWCWPKLWQRVKKNKWNVLPFVFKDINVEAMMNISDVDDSLIWFLTDDPLFGDPDGVAVWMRWTVGISSRSLVKASVFEFVLERVRCPPPHSHTVPTFQTFTVGSAAWAAGIKDGLMFYLDSSRPGWRLFSPAFLSLTAAVTEVLTLNDVTEFKSSLLCSVSQSYSVNASDPWSMVCVFVLICWGACLLLGLNWGPVSVWLFCTTCLTSSVCRSKKIQIWR